MDPDHQESQAPPILQGDFQVPSPPSSWPKVLGVISIVFGALGGLVNLWGVVGPLFLDAIAKMAAQDPAAQASINAQKDYASYTMLVSGLCVIGSLLLLISGVGLCLRKPWGVKATKIWAPWRMVTAVLAAILGYVVMQASLKAMAQHPNSGPAAMMGQGMGLFFVAFGLLWGWAYPVFVLIWFRRQKIRDEVQSWA